MYKIIKNHSHALKYASIRLKKDKAFIKLLILKDGNILKYADKSLQNNPKFVQIALDNGLNSLTFASEKIQNNRNFAIKLLSEFSNSIHTIHPSFYEDSIYMLEAIKKNPYNITYSQNGLKYDTSLALIALKKDIKIHQYLPNVLKEKNIIKKYLQQNLSYLPKKIKRKIKPKAWEMYTVEDTLEELYGKDKNYTQDKDITINRGEKLFAESDETVKIKISSKKDIKSIAILQEDENEKNSLVALYYPKDGFVNLLSMQIKFKDNIWSSTHSFNPNFNLIIVLEDYNNKLYKYTYSYEISTCDQGEYREDEFLDRVKAYLQKPKRSKVKIYRGSKSIKLRFRHPMISYNDAKLLNTKVNFISHIEAFRSSNKIFDFYTSCQVSPRCTISKAIS